MLGVVPCTLISKACGASCLMNLGKVGEMQECGDSRVVQGVRGICWLTETTMVGMSGAFNAAIGMT